MPWHICIAGILGALGVIASAYGAHGLATLEGMDAIRQSAFQSATNMVLFHALALLATAAMGTQYAKLAHWAAGFFTCGACLFAAPLYALALFDTRAFVMAAPIGGALLILGWTMLAVAGLLYAWRRKK